MTTDKETRICHHVMLKLQDFLLASLALYLLVAQLSTVSVLLFRPSYLVKTTISEKNEKIELACVGTDRVVMLCLSGTTTL